MPVLGCLTCESHSTFVFLSGSIYSPRPQNAPSHIPHSHAQWPISQLRVLPTTHRPRFCEPPRPYPPTHFSSLPSSPCSLRDMGRWRFNSREESRACTADCGYGCGGHLASHLHQHAQGQGRLGSPSMCHSFVERWPSC